MSRFMRGLFQTARTISTIVPPAPAEGPGGRLPHGGVCCMVQRWNVCAIVFWRVVWYRAGTFLHVVATRRWMLVFAMVLAWSVLSWFAI